MLLVYIEVRIYIDVARVYRPGSKPVNEKQEWNRINKILKLIVKKYQYL